MELQRWALALPPQLATLISQKTPAVWGISRIFRDLQGSTIYEDLQGLLMGMEWRVTQSRGASPHVGWLSLAGSTEISCLKLQAKAAQSLWLLSRLPPPKGSVFGAELAEVPRGHYLRCEWEGRVGRPSSAPRIISQQRICIHTSFPITGLAQVTRKSWGKEKLGRLLGI